MNNNKTNLIWIDMEMTGLNPEQDRILEIALIITDSNLNIIAEGFSLAVKQPDQVLNAMDEWNKTWHGRSGLIERVRTSDLTEEEAERRSVEFLQKYVAKNASPMCGNSICQDRRFMARYMPTLERYFHYRHIDVTTIKELARRWLPDVYNSIAKKSTHIALNDIRDSIEELRSYRDVLFKNP